MPSADFPEENSPLVYSLHVDNSCEDPLVQRSSSITNGATTILSQWPTNISQPTRAIIGVICFAVVVVATIVIMYSLTTALVPAAFPIPRAVSKRSSYYCDKQDRGNGLSNYLLHADTETSLKPNERRIFFIKSYGENLTEGDICALKSASGEGRVVLMVVLPATTAKDEVKIVGEIQEAGLEEVVDVVVADPASYFNETPLGGFGDDDGSPWRRELQNFAYKVATVWRFAGAAYDLDIVTLKAIPKAEHRLVPSGPSPGTEPGTLTSSQVPEITDPIVVQSTDSLKASTAIKPKTKVLESPEDQTMTMAVPIDIELAVSTTPAPSIETWTWDHSDKMAVDANATVSYDGAILTANQPCHAFVFAVMRELMEIDLRRENATVATVVKRALTSFGGVGSKGCNGVKVIAKDRLCSEVTEQCAWTRVSGEDRGFDWNKYCP